MIQHRTWYKIIGEHEKHLIPLILIVETIHGRKVWIRLKDKVKIWEIIVEHLDLSLLSTNFKSYMRIKTCNFYKQIMAFDIRNQDFILKD